MTWLGNHAAFILAAYGLTVLIVGLLVIWIVIDGRSQRRRLTELETRGIRRRSARKGEPR